MTYASTGNPPGFNEPKAVASVALLWSAEARMARIVTLDAASEDAANSPSTRLRAGLVLAQHATTGRFHPYHPMANDGTQNPVGILEHAVDMLADGAPADRVGRMLTAGAVRERHVPNLDPRVRDLLGGNFRWDEHPPGARSPFAGRIKRISGSHAIEAADHATTFVVSGAASLSLPAPQPGLAFRFVQTTDNPLTIGGAANLLARGGAAANWIEFDTASQRIGTNVAVECVPLDDETLGWLVHNPGGTTYTTS